MDVTTRRADINKAAKLITPRLGSKDNVRRSLDALANRTPRGETVEALAAYYPGMGYRLSFMVLTDRTLHYIATGLVQTGTHIPLDTITAVAVQTYNHRFAKLIVHVGADIREYEGFLANEANNLVVLLRSRVERARSAPTPTSAGVAGQIGELAELHRAGALTDAEFTQAKTKVLARS